VLDRQPVAVELDAEQVRGEVVARVLDVLVDLAVDVLVELSEARLALVGGEVDLRTPPRPLVGSRACGRSR
jgi:hypothetical protein